MSDSTPAPASVAPLTLVCHSLTPAPMVRALTAGAVRTPDGGLALFYRLSGDMVRLRIPAPQPPGRSDGLWEHSCFEAFVAIAGKPAYREFNFSPSGQWAAYAFSDYRRRAPDGPAMLAPQTRALLSAGRLELSALIGADALPPDAACATLHIGLAAVIESGDTVDGARSYWALRHESGPPDFHRRDAFVLELPALP